MNTKRITAHRALTLLRYCERVRQNTTDRPEVRCVIDELIDALDPHVRAAMKGRR